MPELPNLSVDPLAITAIGFLAVVLVLTIGLFAWLFAPHKRKR